MQNTKKNQAEIKYTMSMYKTTDHMSQLVVYSAVVGSRMYGLANEHSDTDMRDVYMFPMLHVLSPFAEKEYTRRDDDIDDIVGYELRHFVQLLTKGNPSIMEILFSHKYEVSPEFEGFKNHHRWFLDTTAIQRAHVGMADNLRHHIIYKAMNDDEYKESAKGFREVVKGIVSARRMLNNAMQLLTKGNLNTKLEEQNQSLYHELFQIKNMKPEDLSDSFLEDMYACVESEIQAVKSKGSSVRVLTPKYGKIEEELLRVYQMHIRS